jgi:hypothetical protein
MRSTSKGRLVSYRNQKTPKLSEKWLAVLECIVGPLGVITTFLGTIWFVTRGAYFLAASSLVSGSDISVYIVVTVLSVLIGWYSIHSADKLRRTRFYYYKDIQQGKILELTTRGGGISKIEWCVVIEGNNRRNQHRTQTYTVNAGEWNGGNFVVGEYIDFR